MKRRKLIGLMAGTVAGGAFLNAVGACTKDDIETDENLNSYVSSKVIYASSFGAKLDSNVITGGGTDDTEIIQSILDKAPEMGSLCLIMDGAALIKGINIHSQTTIECLNSSCGFFLAAKSNRSVIRNANPSMLLTRKDKNISIIGGTYNHNAKGQDHDVIENGIKRGVFGMEFYGVENFIMRDLTFRNQRTWAMRFANWFRVNMENISVDLSDHMDGENQDGIHFFGPGRFLTMQNIQGNSGDDFIALAPDELDSVSSITDVLIDGVLLNNADQGIRLLSRGQGLLDRIIIKNITGTYKSFGFFIDHTYKGDGGNYGNIVIDTVDLRQSTPNYDYTTPFLFRLAGNFESLTLNNIYHHNPSDSRSIIDIGWPTEETRFHDNTLGYIRSLVIDGLHIFESDNKAADASFIKVLINVDTMVVRNTEILRSSGEKLKGCLIETFNTAKINTLIMSNIYATRINNLLLHKDSDIKTVQLNNVLGSEIGDVFIRVENGNIDKVNASGVYGAKLVETSNGGSIGEVVSG